MTRLKQSAPLFLIRAAILLVAFLSGYSYLFAQIKLPVYNDSSFSTYYWQKSSFAKSLSATNGDIVFLGNSITDGAEWSELFNDLNVKSRGISGDVTAGIVNRLQNIASRKPDKIFLLIGTNDLARKISPDSVVKNILLIADYLRQESPATQLFVQSILPVNNFFGKFPDHTGNNQKINMVNAALQKMSSAHHYRYIDLHSFFKDASGKLDTAYTNDGLHLLGAGYALWKHLIYADVYDLNQKPSLIPLPQSLKWNKENFPLYACKNILIKNKDLQKEAEWLQQQIAEKGWNINIVNTIKNNVPYIELNLGKVNAPQLNDEAYQLKVSADKISLVANTPHGIFNAIQTLAQLMRDGSMINACEITDWPAFPWRGYMVDAGRNFQSMEMLKQQIDKMAFYKLNIFHFHFTEDIAWRLESKMYPQLTAPENMIRNKGEYYTESDMKELIAYCRERYITLVPEIDMPGHSAAFKRAMHTDMQSDSGVAIIKNILQEFCKNYNLAYMHIGADEVHIRNKNFVPDITKFLEGLGKKTIGWEPGGNFLPSTIRQLWMDDNGALADASDIQYIDSRHLYLNHMDPLEAVVTIFNRQIGNKIKGDKNMLGGTLCMWPDRRVANENDILQMNAVYTGMMAFAERTWRGGGYRGWITNVEKGNQENEFLEFEQRLLDHKDQYFKNIPFPYYRQGMMHWDLFGPYKNENNLSKSCAPENKNFTDSPSLNAIGGTIILRHWWAPLIKGVVNNPQENTAWYASTKIWSDEEKLQNFWIGFNDISRSPATDSPKPGTWDNHQSKVWVNGKVVEPPHWKHGGQTGDSEIPLIDEGYAYREPTKILLKKGWNTILIKAPIGTFKGKDWQNPEKWMFTFLPVE
ncbi:MAG TPA: family 20 glycosylhydrolase [Hanamia sp.]|nr:family 20 glycosylhydrolase [Hanamia sp.]